MKIFSEVFLFIFATWNFSLKIFACHCPFWYMCWWCDCYVLDPDKNVFFFAGVCLMRRVLQRLFGVVSVHCWHRTNCHLSVSSARVYVLISCCSRHYSCFWANNTHTHNLLMALCPGVFRWVGTRKKWPTHILPFVNFLHLLRSIASSLFNLPVWQSFSTTSV